MAKKIKIEEYQPKTTRKNIVSKEDNKKTLNFLFIGLLVIVLIIATVFITLAISSNGEKSKTIDDEKEENTNEPINLEDLVPEDCVFVRTDDVKKIEITAESSAGVGDVFSKTISKNKYKIKDNKIGDIFVVNYKYNGDESRYECDEDWYSITLSDGTEGFIWAGKNNAYVRVLK